MNATLPAPPAPSRPVPFVEQLKRLHWTQLDGVYTAVRREVAKRRDWRYGPARVREVAREGFDAVASHRALPGTTYCDLGCGVYHPFGVATAMFLNGADAALALDLKSGDLRRAAEALADLLLECLARPELWHWSGVPRDEFLARARRFDLDALQAGDFAAGVAGVPLRHVVTDIHHPQLAPGSIDVMTSRAVLEHFLDFGRAVERLYELMRPGAVAFHLIDIVDHRAYEDPKQYHWWSFLAENETWTDGLCNRLRSCEIRPHFERVGFELLRYETQGAPLPDGFRRRLAPHYRSLSDEELAVTTVRCLLRKSAA